MLGIDDDAHIFVILRAHMTAYEDFVTLQYLCGMAYNPMPGWVFANLTTTLVLPLGLLVLVLLSVKTLVDWKDCAPKDPAVVFVFALVRHSLCTAWCEGHRQVTHAPPAVVRVPPFGAADATHAPLLHAHAVPAG